MNLSTDFLRFGLEGSESFSDERARGFQFRIQATLRVALGSVTGEGDDEDGNHKFVGYWIPS